MSAPSSRPTREQVEAALAFADHAWTGSSRMGHLAAEVRALRAELNAQNNELTVRRLQDLVAARTPQPAEPTALVLAAREYVRSWRYGGGRNEATDALFAAVDALDAAPQPAVPDGEDVPARLDSAADACEAAGWTGTAYGFRDLASQLRSYDDDVDGVRAAVAAALARTPGRES